MNILQWIRRKFHIEYEPTQFEAEHYASFEKALQESDVLAYVYSNSIRGEQIIRRGEDLHVVTVQNLVSFCKLNRETRRRLDKKVKMAQHGN